ncbi:MAG: hypothetical protein ACRDZ5_03415 [Acidimicrobiales bacterium]
MSLRRGAALVLVGLAIVVAVFNVPAEGPVLLTLATGRGIAVNDLVAVALVLGAIYAWFGGHDARRRG